MNYTDLCRKLQKIKQKGFIKTHRKGPTGVGKTLEDLLGIKENNVPGPNAAELELKSVRKDSDSMLTLFSKSPAPRGANSKLLRAFGYEDENNRGIVLHTTITASSFNTLKGEKGFKIEPAENEIKLIDKNFKCWSYWKKEKLRESFKRKYPHGLIYVKAEFKKIKNKVTGEIIEEFWYNEGFFLENFSFDGFISLLKEGVIKIDIRIGRYPDGRVHDHGTAFRVLERHLDVCFEKRISIM